VVPSAVLHSSNPPPRPLRLGEGNDITDRGRRYPELHKPKANPTRPDSAAPVLRVPINTQTLVCVQVQGAPAPRHRQWPASTEPFVDGRSVLTTIQDRFLSLRRSPRLESRRNNCRRRTRRPPPTQHFTYFTASDSTWRGCDGLRPEHDVFDHCGSPRKTAPVSAAYRASKMPPEHRANDRPTYYTMKTPAPMASVSSQGLTHSRANSQSYISTKRTTSPMSSSRPPPIAGQPHPPKLSPGGARAAIHDARTPSPNYFGLAVDATVQADPRDSCLLPRENWSSPSSSVKSFAAAIPKQLPLDANPNSRPFAGRWTQTERGRPSAYRLPTSA